MGNENFGRLTFIQQNDLRMINDKCIKKALREKNFVKSVALEM